MKNELKLLKEKFAALNEVVYTQLHLYNKLNKELVAKLEELKKQIEEIERGLYE